MAKVLYVALQTPSVEMKIKSEPDCAGKTETMIAVFTRHNTTEAERIRNQMAEIQRQSFTDAVELAVEVSRLKEYFSYLTKDELDIQVVEGREVEAVV